MSKRFYINDFCYDLNYNKVILYIGDVNLDRLRKALEESVVNKIYRLEYALTKTDRSDRNYIYVENCDLQDLSWPVHEYIEDGYSVYVLREDAGRFYVEVDICE